MLIAPLPGPYGLYNVSVMPRFLLDSSRVGWQGAYFTDILGADEGVVDHGHERYCLQRGLHREGRRPLGRRTWQDVRVGISVWRSGDEQRFQWRNGGRSQFLFVAPGRVAAVLGDDRLLARAGQDAPLQSPLLDLIFDALQADLAQGSPAGPLVGDSLIAALVASLAAPATPAATDRLSAQARNRAIDFIEARFASPISLQELAEAAGLGVRQFTRAFREATGRSAHQYLLHRRVEQAKVLIRQGLPLADVAVQCGFCDQSQLTRTFARHVGTSPGRFRAST
ncbi:MAG: helix-turn-helix transcriptional regulator [Burkholderiaceae bacterium]|nr:helix-turn-helix transcriptional regulator [Burkholderiaceae bacterium]